METAEIKAESTISLRCNKELANSRTQLLLSELIIFVALQCFFHKQSQYLILLLNLSLNVRNLPIRND